MWLINGDNSCNKFKLHLLAKPLNFFATIIFLAKLLYLCDKTSTSWQNLFISWLDLYFLALNFNFIAKTLPIDKTFMYFKLEFYLTKPLFFIAKVQLVDKTFH
jgi:hypothetical protein